MDAKKEEKPQHLIRPYGDRMDDGVMQVAFVLPVAPSEKAREAARMFLRQMGLSDVKVSTMEPAGEKYSFFIAYGRTSLALDYSSVDVPEVVVRKLGFADLNAWMEKTLGRKVVVFGACTGTDSHTVGIDAIMNMKGFAGDYGLERYTWYEAHNLGAQVPNEELVAQAKAGNADAVLVSQVVTQREIHRENARDFILRAKDAGLFGKAILLLGGPRVDHGLARELGFDAGFGAGTHPSDVANFIAHAVAKKLGKE